MDTSKATPKDGEHYFDEKQKEMVWATPPASDRLRSYATFATLPCSSDSTGLAERASHLVLGVTDLDRSEAWYRDVFAMDVVGRDLTNEERPHSVLRTNSGHLLILVQQDEVAPMRPGASGVHHSFIMTPNQYRRFLDRMKTSDQDLGVFRADFLAPGEYATNFKDPDGHGVEIDTIGSESDEVSPPGVGVVDCGPADTYAVGAVRMSNEGNFFLVRLDDGFLAVTRRCTHMNGLLTYDPDHWRFVCPYHHASFNRCGDPLGGQAYLNALRINPVSFAEHDHVLVDTDVVIQRKQFNSSDCVSPPASVRAPQEA